MNTTGSKMGPAKHGSPLRRFLSKLLIDRRQRLDITQKELARRAGVAYNVVGYCETGRTTPNLENLESILHVLGYQLQITPIERKGEI